MLIGNHPRGLQGVAYTASWQPLGSDGEIATADPGTVTVGVIRSDGTVVVAAGTATGGAALAPRTIALTVAQMAQLDRLTFTWKVGATTVAVTYLDVVGGVYFTIPELRAAETALADATADPALTLIALRSETESSFESWTNLAMVPRFSVVEATAAGCSLSTGVFFVRAVRWVRQWTSDSTYTDLSAGDCAAIRASESGVLERTAGWSGRVQIGLEHGLDAPPPDGKRMAMLYTRIRAALASGTGHNVASFTTADGQTVTYEPKADPTHYKIINEFLRRPDIDHRLPGFA